MKPAGHAFGSIASWLRGLGEGSEIEKHTLLLKCERGGDPRDDPHIDPYIVPTYSPQS